MDRKTFISQCTKACIGGLVLGGLWSGCGSTEILNGQITGDNLVIPISDFSIQKEGINSFKSHVIVHPNQLKFPIVVFRFSAEEYTALWMRCSHQGAELQVFGDKLQCPAHGSEFDNQGVAETGPAIEMLRKFPVTIAENNLLISLKAV